jgi:hypothetical protein
LEGLDEDAEDHNPEWMILLHLPDNLSQQIDPFDQ